MHPQPLLLCIRRRRVPLHMRGVLHRPHHRRAPRPLHRRRYMARQHGLRVNVAVLQEAVGRLEHGWIVARLSQRRPRARPQDPGQAHQALRPPRVPQHRRPKLRHRPLRLSLDAHDPFAHAPLLPFVYFQPISPHPCW